MTGPILTETIATGPAHQALRAPRRERIAARVLAWLLCLPLLVPLLVLALSWRDPQPEIWSHLAQWVLPDVIGNTLALAALLALLTAALGVGLAWLSACCEYPGRRTLDWALMLPLALPGYVVAFAYVGLTDYAGPVQSAWRALSGSRTMLFDLRSVGGAALVLALVSYPYVYLLARASFRRQGASAFEAARSLGRGPLSAFWHVAVPMARPAWVAGVTLAVLEALADFGAVSILGVDTFSTTIYKTWFGLGSLAGAAQLAVVLLVLVGAVLVIERALRPRGGVAPPGAARTRRVVLRRPAALAAAAAQWLVLALGFVVPTVQLLAWAARAEGGVGAMLPVAGNTLLLGMLVAVAAIAMGLLLIACEHRARGARSVAAPVFVANLGYAVPGTVLAVAVMLVLVHGERLVAEASGVRLALSTGIAGLLLALVARFLRVGHGALEAGFAQLRPSLLEAAASLGATPWRRFVRVTLPMLRPSLLAALLLVLVETMKEMPATLMLRPFGWDTLAVRIYGYTTEGLWIEASRPALLLVAAGLVPVWWLVRHGSAADAAG